MLSNLIVFKGILMMHGSVREIIIQGKPKKITELKKSWPIKFRNSFFCNQMLLFDRSEESCLKTNKCWQYCTFEWTFFKTNGYKMFFCSLSRRFFSACIWNFWGFPYRSMILCKQDLRPVRGQCSIHMYYVCSSYDSFANLNMFFLALLFSARLGLLTPLISEAKFWGQAPWWGDSRQRPTLKRLSLAMTYPVRHLFSSWRL